MPTVRQELRLLTLRALAAVLSVTAVVSAQTPEPPPFTRRLPGGTFLASNMTVRNLIAFAYSLQRFQVEGRPDWIDALRTH